MKRALLSLAALLLATALPGRAQTAPTDTIIECAGAFETVSTATEIVSTFRDHVVVTGTNISLTCDYLRVVALQKTAQTTALGQYGYFKSLVATGHVKIVQGDREATCGRAEIFPGDDKIVLTEQPVVSSTDGQYVARGPRMVLYRGRRQAVIEGSPEERVRITLPPVKDLGFEEEKTTPPPAAKPPAK
ncbi:LptA/OstA family protein [Horticoccus luteus]|uniref:LptA/OstA family protein n=1 Tax=Horticoccus luteus TaxID=2862869 RepID=A0A8F9TU89_9BACT|nr:LptA/OstA family protein [Horticoccus luteus]QYM77883.1 LptA/OstA family protein [Horticoccus luteus]